MIQRIYIPKDFKLRQVVNFMSYVEFMPEDHVDGWTAIFPNATSNLLISLHDSVSINQTEIYHSIGISCSSTVAFNPKIRMKFITVQFNSYGVYYLKSIPVYELHNSLSPLDLFFKPSEIDSITNQLREPGSIAQKFECLELFLAQRIEIQNFDKRLPYAIASLKSQKHIRIDELSEAVCLSSRALLKLFNKYVGMSPAYYKKIARFNLAANLILNHPNTSLTSIALACGYYDQAHFIKDFRQFGGISPSDFLQFSAKSSDFYNYILKDIRSLEPS